MARKGSIMYRLRAWFERKITVGVDSIYGPAYKKWFLWYGWAIGDATLPPSKYRMITDMPLLQAIVANVRNNLSR